MIVNFSILINKQESKEFFISVLNVKYIKIASSYIFYLKKNIFILNVTAQVFNGHIFF